MFGETKIDKTNTYPVRGATMCKNLFSYTDHIANYQLYDPSSSIGRIQSVNASMATYAKFEDEDYPQEISTKSWFGKFHPHIAVDYGRYRTNSKLKPTNRLRDPITNKFVSKFFLWTVTYSDLNLLIKNGEIRSAQGFFANNPKTKFLIKSFIAGPLMSTTNLINIYSPDYPKVSFQLKYNNYSYLTALEMLEIIAKDNRAVSYFMYVLQQLVGMPNLFGDLLNGTIPHFPFHILPFYGDLTFNPSAPSMTVRFKCNFVFGHHRTHGWAVNPNTLQNYFGITLNGIDFRVDSFTYNLDHLVTPISHLSDKVYDMIGTGYVSRSLIPFINEIIP